MKKLAILAAALLLCASLASCGAAAGKNESYRDSSDLYYAETTAAGYDIGYLEPSAAGDSYKSESSDGSDGKDTIREEKLVYTANVTLESEDFDTASDALHQKIASLGGIIVSENAYNLNKKGYGGRSMDMTVRIPQENYETFLAGLSDICNVAAVNRYVENLTERYYDNENRLKSYRIQEERLFAMLEKAESVTEMLEIVSLKGFENRKVTSLSGGQQQRVAIARAISTRPPIIMADEPTGALDSKTGHEVLQFLQQLNKEGSTVILITHDNGIAATARRCVRLADGKIVDDRQQEVDWL